MANDSAAGVAAALAEKPEAGKTTIDDKMRFGPLRLAYESARALALDIAITVADRTKGKTVVIAGTQMLADYANMQAALLTLEGLKKDYETLTEFIRKATERKKPAILREGVDLSASTSDAAPAAAAAAAAVGANPFVAAALGAIALLQSDVEFHGVDMKVDRLAFELALAGALAEREAKEVIVPDFVLRPLAVTKDSLLRTALEAVAEARMKAWLAAAPLIRRVLDAEVELDKAADEKDAEKKAAAVKKAQAELDAARRDLEPVNTPLMRADQALDDLQSQWRKIEAGESLSTLARMLRVEALTRRVAGAEEPVYLHCAVVESGGHHRISRNLFRMLFLGDGLSFAGGAIVRWALLNANGVVQRAGMITTEQKL